MLADRPILVSALSSTLVFEFSLFSLVTIWVVHSPEQIKTDLITASDLTLQAVPSGHMT